jgi:hypothetical protein
MSKSLSRSYRRSSSSLRGTSTFSITTHPPTTFKSLVSLLRMIISKWTIIGRRYDGQYKSDQEPGNSVSADCILPIPGYLYGLGIGGVLVFLSLTKSTSMVWYLRDRQDLCGRKGPCFAEPDLVEVRLLFCPMPDPATILITGRSACQKCQSRRMFWCDINSRRYFILDLKIVDEILPVHEHNYELIISSDV